MVAQVLRRPRRGASRVGDDLCRSRLAADVLAVDTRATAGAARRVDDVPHAVTDRRQLLRADFDDRLRRRCGHRLPLRPVGDRPEDVRRDADAAVAQRRRVDRQRDRRHRYLSLADRHGNGFAGVPLRLARRRLPGRGRDESGHLVGQIDVRLHAEPEERRPLVDAIDAEHVADVVEVDVAGLLDRLSQVDRTVALLLVALEIAAVEGLAAGAKEGGRGSDDAFLEAGQSDRHLERRSGRIAPLQRAVLQRLELVGVERVPGCARDAGGESVRVVGRTAGERQHLAVARIEDHCRAVERRGREAILGGLLHVGVDGQLHALPLGRLLFVPDVDLAPEAVDDHFLGAVLAHQVAVQRLLDAGVADDRARLGAAVLVGDELRFGDLADIAEHVRGQLARRVFPRRDRLIDDAGQVPRGDGEPLFPCRVLDEHDRPVARLAAPAIHRLPHHRFVRAGRQRQGVQRLIEVLRLLAHQRDVEGALVVDQDLAVAIEQHAARRRQRQPAQMVLFGDLFEFLVLRDLEDPEDDRQRPEDHRDDDLQRREAHRQAAAILRHHHGGCGHTDLEKRATCYWCYGATCLKRAVCYVLVPRATGHVHGPTCHARVACGTSPVARHGTGTSHVLSTSHRSTSSTLALTILVSASSGPPPLQQAGQALDHEKRR